jgi:hypothetical protein
MEYGVWSMVHRVYLTSTCSEYSECGTYIVSTVHRSSHTYTVYIYIVSTVHRSSHTYRVYVYSECSTYIVSTVHRSSHT